MRKYRNSDSEVFFWIVLGSIVTLIFALNIYRTITAEEVRRDYEITYGKIIRYIDLEMSVEGKKRTITYSYRVGPETYYRKIPTDIKFMECSDPIEAECAYKRFWVIYSRRDPTKSLINFKLQLQAETNPKFPKTLNDFQ